MDDRTQVLPVALGSRAEAGHWACGARRGVLPHPGTPGLLQPLIPLLGSQLKGEMLVGAPSGLI